MKILTIGSGVIGTTYFWQLHKAGFDLTHYIRKKNMASKCQYLKATGSIYQITLAKQMERIPEKGTIIRSLRL